MVTTTFVHIGLEHFVLQYDHPLLGTFGRRSQLWISFLSSLSLIRHGRHVFVAILSPDVVAAGSTTASLDCLGPLVLCALLSKVLYSPLSDPMPNLILVNLIFSFMPGISMAGHQWLSSSGWCWHVFPVRGSSLYEPAYQMSAAPILSLTFAFIS